jgi:hypothetical protein
VPDTSSSVLCWSAGAHDRPTCLIAAELERVAIEKPGTQGMLAEWQL